MSRCGFACNSAASQIQFSFFLDCVAFSCCQWPIIKSQIWPSSSSWRCVLDPLGSSDDTDRLMIPNMRSKFWLILIAMAPTAHNITPGVSESCSGGVSALSGFIMLVKRRVWLSNGSSESFTSSWRFLRRLALVFLFPLWLKDRNKNNHSNLWRSLWSAGCSRRVARWSKFH